MTNENLIHVKLDYREALRSKRTILSSEMNLLRLIKTIEHYKFLRLKELKLKEDLSKKTKEVKTIIRRLEKSLPKSQIPKTIRKPQGTEKETLLKKEDKSIEGQLREIQGRLDVLQRESI